jgi:hypothetical protein
MAAMAAIRAAGAAGFETLNLTKNGGDSKRFRSSFPRPPPQQGRAKHFRPRLGKPGDFDQLREG